MSDSVQPHGLPASSVHGIIQERILEWVAISLSRGYSWPRVRTYVSYISRWILYPEPPGKHCWSDIGMESGCTLRPKGSTVSRGNCSICHNSVPWTRWLQQQEPTWVQLCRLAVQDQGVSKVAKAPFLGLLTAFFSGPILKTRVWFCFEFSKLFTEVKFTYRKVYHP